jgi:replicative DNA helicase
VADADTSGATIKTYEFDDEFQLELTALICRDGEFNAKVEGLVDPSYLTDHLNGILVRLARDYFDKYRFPPSTKIWTTLIREGIDKKILRKDDSGELVARLKECLQSPLTDAAFITEHVAEFARRQALEAAILEAVELIDKNKFDKVEGLIKTAMNVGVNEETNRYDFWENVESRAHYRQEVLAGRIKPDGITTGFKEFDDELYNRGWGRRELSVLMAPAKGGKSMALIGFGLAAVLAGYNVAYVTLEVAARIIADRSDANLSSTKMSDLQNAIGVVKGRVQAKQTKAGRFDLYDFPTGSLSPMDLRRLLSRKKSQGVKYDLIIVDYADLMRPDMVSQESRENSRLIYVGLRAIAQEFNAAMLSATQTNREGFKATAGKMEHVSEDINKARTVDLLLSLNAGDEEKKNNEARIYLAASRNQRSDVTIKVRTDFERAKYIAGILAVE